MTRPTFVVYSRAGCHLCEILIEELAPLLRDRADLDVRDTDARAEWQEAFGERIPVVEQDGRILCQYRLDRAAILAVLESCGSRDGAAPGGSGA